jgi:hypothetical protein
MGCLGQCKRDTRDFLCTNPAKSYLYSYKGCLQLTKFLIENSYNYWADVLGLFPILADAIGQKLHNKVLGEFLLFENKPMHTLKAANRSHVDIESVEIHLLRLRFVFGPKPPFDLIAFML